MQTARSRASMRAATFQKMRASRSGSLLSPRWRARMRISGRSPSRYFGRSCRLIPLGGSGPMTIPTCWERLYAGCDNALRRGHELPVRANDMCYSAAPLRSRARGLEAHKIRLQRGPVSQRWQHEKSAMTIAQADASFRTMVPTWSPRSAGNNKCGLSPLMIWNRFT
jgi:hypothetical protein